jgi:hypothetical protein
MRKLCVSLFLLIGFLAVAPLRSGYSSLFQQTGHAEVPFEAFYQSYEPQAKDQWCWAACISMLFDYYEHPVSQERIVKAVYGIPVNMPARAGVIIARQVNKDWIDDKEESFKSRITAAYDLTEGVFNLDNRVLVNELDSGNPIIIGVGPHAVVLVAVDYVIYPNGLIDVTRATVFDPWPGIGVRRLTPHEMRANYPYGYHFAVTIRIED